jgi:dephospho-CoA kinase
VIGLTGAIGVGKSSVLAAFALRGYPVLSADAVVHDLYLRTSMRDQLVAHFGADVLGADGEVDRPALARRCFSDVDALVWLEGLLHPLVSDQFAAWVEQFANTANPPALVVYESPLLFEAGQTDRFDRVLVVTAPETTRRSRLEARGQLARAAEREARLWPADRREAAADDLLDNSGTHEQLQEAVDGYIARYAER